MNEQATDRHSVRRVEPELDKLSKATGVIIHERLGVSKGLQEGIELDDFVLQTAALCGCGALGAEVDDLLHEQLGGFGFSSTRLATDDTDLSK